MYPGRWAEKTPDKPALVMADTGATLSYAQLEDRSLRLANHIRGLGIEPGGHIAVVAENRFEIMEVYWAALRTGTIVTAVNSHLLPAEAAYIVHDSDAQLLVVSAGLSSAAELVELCADVPHLIAVGGALPGAADYEQVLAAASTIRPDFEPRGTDMLYSSGTTGRPKGILPVVHAKSVDSEDVPLVALFTQLWGFDQDTVYLSPAPLYHAAPLRFVMCVHARGGTVVVMPRFDAEAALSAIETYRVTHSQWVPTMFIRLLRLPAEVRESADVSSLQVAVHAAAPCPPQVKQAMIDWWGPVVHEYYSSTEGVGFTSITSAEALARPGSVGRGGLMGTVHVCGPDGAELAPVRSARSTSINPRDTSPITRTRPRPPPPATRTTPPGQRWAILGMSTPRATSTWPTGRTSSSSPAG